MGGTLKKVFILNYRGNQMPEADLQQIKANTNVLDSSRKTLLVEADKEEIQKALNQLENWGCSEEQKIPIPSTKKTIKF